MVYSQYDDIIQTLSSIKEYDIDFKYKINLNEINYYNKNTKEVILEDKKLFDKYIVGIKEFRLINWDENLNSLINFININKRIPNRNENKYINKWYQHQQENYIKNIDNMKNNIIKEKWKNFINDYDEYLLNPNKKWHNKLNDLIIYINTNNKRPNGNDKNIEIKKLAKWCGHQIGNYKTEYQIMKDPNIRKIWEDFMEKYNKYFITKEQQLHINLNNLEKYILINKKKPYLSDTNNINKKLCDWLYVNTENLKLNKKSMKNEDIKNTFKLFLEKYKEYL